MTWLALQSASIFGRDVSGEGTFRLGVAILPSHPNRRAVEASTTSLSMVAGGQTRRSGFRESAGSADAQLRDQIEGRRRPVHLPITGNKLAGGWREDIRLPLLFKKSNARVG